MSLIKKLWPGHTVNVASGNAVNVKDSSSELNYTGTTLTQSYQLNQDFQPGTIISIDYSLDKSNPSVSHATKAKAFERTKQDEKLNVGNRVDFEDQSGIIEEIPNDNIAWVRPNFAPPGLTKGVKLSELKHSVKKDDGKVDLTMLTIEMLELVSRVREFGAKKYARNNFKITGFKYTRSLAAALRHIFAFLNGEDNDPESGLSHLGHAICCLEHLIYDTKHHPENDDRKS